MSRTEPTKLEIREAFGRALNRGDVDTAAKIAVYGALSNPWSSERFSEGLLNSARSHVDGFCSVCGAMVGMTPSCPVCAISRGANERMADMVLDQS